MMLLNLDLSQETEIEETMNVLNVVDTLHFTMHRMILISHLQQPDTSEDGQEQQKQRDESRCMTKYADE